MIPKTEEKIYPLVLSGEFQIDQMGQVWKKGKRAEHDLLAKKYGVTYNAVWEVIHGLHWA